MGHRHEKRELNKARIERKILRTLLSVQIGGTCKIDDCCREVRLGSDGCKEGTILSGYNTIADRYEEQEIVQVNKKAPGRSRVRRVK